jgi:hypothetical protein
MRKIIALLISLFIINDFLYAGKGKIKITANKKGFDIYVNGKKWANTKESDNIIALDAGKYNIKVVKNKNSCIRYVANKSLDIKEYSLIEEYFDLKLEDNCTKIIWEKTFGDDKGSEKANSFIQTKDGNFIIAGQKFISSDMYSTNEDAWIIKLDSNGNKIWDKTFGGKFSDEATSIIQTKDGGFIVAGEIGYTSYRDFNSDFDAWIIKLDKDGNKIWDKTFGDSGWNKANAIIQTNDRGFIFVGNTNVVKLDKNGNEIWNKTFGNANSIIQTKTGEFIFVGNKAHKRISSIYTNVWVTKLDKNGNVIWDKEFGGKDNEEANLIIQTKDGNFVIAGKFSSASNELIGSSAFWIIKIDSSGNKIWDKKYFGDGYDVANAIIQTKNGNFIVAGLTTSKGAGKRDAWIIKLDKNGNKIWDKTFGGKYDDKATSILQSNDGNLVMLGEKELDSGRYIWVLKFENTISNLNSKQQNNLSNLTNKESCYNNNNYNACLKEGLKYYNGKHYNLAKDFLEKACNGNKYLACAKLGNIYLNESGNALFVNRKKAKKAQLLLTGARVSNTLWQISI